MNYNLRFDIYRRIEKVRIYNVQKDLLTFYDAKQTLRIVFLKNKIILKVIKIFICILASVSCSIKLPLVSNDFYLLNVKLVFKIKWYMILIQ